MQNDAEQQITPRHVRLVDDLHLAAARALDAEEPTRERGERLAKPIFDTWAARIQGKCMILLCVAGDLHGYVVPRRAIFVVD
jgi:hypothetical protein